MRLFTTLSLVLLTTVNSLSQVSPEAIIARIPSLPANACELSKEKMDLFRNKLDEVADLCDNEIKERKEQYNDFLDKRRAIIPQKMGEKMGLSKTDAAKLNPDGNLSEADAMAMAGKMMEKNYNMSIDEAKKLGNMSKEGQKAWAEGYGNEMMADAQANPAKYAGKMKADKNNFDLAAEKQTLTLKTMAEGAKFSNLLQEINDKDKVEKKNLARIIEPFEKELDHVNFGEGSTKSDWDKGYNLKMKIWEAQKSYCSKMTPILIDYLNRYLTSVKANLPDYYRLQELTDKLMEEQTGLPAGKLATDLMAMQSITDLLHQMKDVFRFSPGEKPER